MKVLKKLENVISDFRSSIQLITIRIPFIFFRKISGMFRISRKFSTEGPKPSSFNLPIYATILGITVGIPFLSYHYYMK